MRRIKKHFFTLLELLVVLIILSLGMAVTGIKIKEAYDEQRLLSEIQQVTSFLQTAQDFMLLLDTDIKVKFIQDPTSKRIKYWMEPEKPIRPQWARIIIQEHELKSVNQIIFEGQAAKDEKGLVLNFFSKGLVMSRGRLLLGSCEKENQDGKTYQIDLIGYPRFIESQRYQPSRIVKEELIADKLSENLYPKEIALEEEEDANKKD